MGQFIPLSIPNFEGNEKKYVDDAIGQGWVSTGGAYIDRFEDQLAQYLKTDRVAACQSGTAGIHLALIECRVMPGDMVIVPTLTFIAAVNPVRYLFADPIFMDCDDSLCIDPIKLERFCEEECELADQNLYFKRTRSKIKAIIVVHVFGNMADMEKIMDIAHRFNLKVIEDATEALGTKYIQGRYNGRYAGTIGDYGIYSFNGNKIITTGGGGAVVAKQQTHLKHIKYLSTQAKDDSVFYIHHEVGYNYRMTNVQAAIGAAQLEELPTFIKRKQENYKIYKELLKDCRSGRLLDFRKEIDSNKWFYSFVLADDKITVKKIIEKLSENNIQSRAVWGLVHEQKPYENDAVYNICKAPFYQKMIINLPCSTQLKQSDISKVVKTLKTIC